MNESTTPSPDKPLPESATPTQPGPSSPAAPTPDAAALRARRRKRRRIGLVLLVLGGISTYAFLRTQISPFVKLEAVWQDSVLKRLRPQEFERQVARDMTELAAYREGLDRTATRLAALRPQLPADASTMTPDQRRRLKEVWVSFLDYQIGLDGMKSLYQAFPGISRWSGSKDDWRHARAFAVAYLIHLVQVGEGTRFIDPFIGNTNYENVLDEADAAAGIPQGSYARLKLKVIHLQTLTEIRLLHAYLDTLREEHFAPYLAAEPKAPDAWVVAEIDRRYPAVRDWYKDKGGAGFAANTSDVVSEDLFDRWFPIQKNVAEWMGDTRTTGRPALIKPDQVEAMRPTLLPGDIFLERRNWYLSNVGLPGFWPHAALYVGTPEEMAAFFDGDADTAAWCRESGAEGVLAMARKRYPAVAEAQHARVHEHPCRILEAVSEGVVFNSLEHTCDADYVAVLRPRLSKLDRFKAILAGYSHWGKPYDFRFDFVTDDQVVCSELVYKAYLPDTGKKGLKLDLQEMMGIKVYPPHEMIGVFRREMGTPDAQFDFVYFLDGMESQGRAVVASAQALSESYNRPKWDLSQK